MWKSKLEWKEGRKCDLPPSDALPFPSVLFYIHSLRSNLNHVDVLILRLLVCLMGQTPSAPCPSSVHPEAGGVVRRATVHSVDVARTGGGGRGYG